MKSLLDPAYTHGEPISRHANALEPGLYFEPLRLPQQRELLDRALAESGTAPGRADPPPSSPGLCPGKNFPLRWELFSPPLRL